jgi:pilus assembly protein CpaC
MDLTNTGANMMYFQNAVKHNPRGQRLKTAKSRSHHWVLKPLSLSLRCLLASMALSAYAESANPSTASTTAPDETLPSDAIQPRNAYAENLRPKLKRPTALQNRPYNPIKKQDDQGQIPEIEMFVGESRVFPTPGVARIAVGNGRIMTAAALDSKEVIIFANDVGTSSLFVWNEDGRYQRVKVNIVPGDTTRIAREVAAFLTTIPNTKASIVGDKVIVEGDNLSDADLAKVEQLQKPYPQIVNFTNRIGWEQMVMMDVKVVEFPTTELREIGLKWNAVGGAAIGGIWRPITRVTDGPYQVNIQTGQNNSAPITNPSGTGGVVLPAAVNVLGAVNLGLNAQLNLLAQEGKASVLAEPQLSTRNGAKASFLAGGEFPYSVSNANGVTIIFKKYGINLQIAPKVDRNGIIRATIEAEVSSIDASVSTISGPALLTRRTETEFNVKSGETIVLSGLLQRSSSTDIDKVPLLGDIPVLGALFRSKRFQNKETELVVFVTPSVIDSRSPGLVDRIERTTERLQQQFGRQPYLSNPLQPGHDPAKTDTKPAGLPPHAERKSTAADGEASAALASVAQAAPIVAVSHGALQQAGPGSRFISANENPLTVKTGAAGGSTLRVKKDGLVIRAEPDTKSEALLQLGYGSVVQMGATDPQPRGVGYWRNVVVGEINGWVLAEWVEPSHFQPSIRPFAKSPVARADQGVSEATNGITHAATRQVTPAAHGASSEGPPKRYRVAVDRLALRVTPDVNAPIIQTLPEGQLVEALPQPPRHYWTAVQAGGIRGWVAGQWLKPVTP